MSQLYEALVSRTTYYRVVIDPTGSGSPSQVLSDMEANDEDIEQFRVMAEAGGTPYGSETQVAPPYFQTLPAAGQYLAALPADSNETADIQCNVADVSPIYT